MEKFKATQTHCGQYKKYGDFFREWSIETEETKEETLKWCFENLYKRRVPIVTEWKEKIKYGGEKFHDADYYFAGYYDLRTIDGGFKFIVCEPYAD